LLEYAFDGLQVRRVAFKTDVRNTVSNTALRRIGATYEGTLRSHRVLPDGSRRDSAYYSMLDTEWPRIRQQLDQILA
jgi:RimJ/RimL family protein N-acetyltransferase